MKPNADSLRGSAGCIILQQIPNGDSCGCRSSKNVCELSGGQAEHREAAPDTAFERPESAGCNRAMYFME